LPTTNKQTNKQLIDLMQQNPLAKHSLPTTTKQLTDFGCKATRLFVEELIPSSKTIVVLAAFLQWLLAAGGDGEERKREDT
jgi:predicted transcriptional regulator